MKLGPVLVVDDDNFWLQYLTRQLEAANYQVMAHSQAASAIDAVDPSLKAIVVDMLLGYNTVLPLLHEIQSDSEVAGVPIIVCSNIADSLLIDSLKEYGVRQVLDKTTMQPNDIVRALKRVSL